jgi:hypothetical protein
MLLGSLCTKAYDTEMALYQSLQHWNSFVPEPTILESIRIQGENKGNNFKENNP